MFPSTSAFVGLERIITKCAGDDVHEEQRSRLAHEGRLPQRRPPAKGRTDSKSDTHQRIEPSTRWHRTS